MIAYLLYNKIKIIIQAEAYNYAIHIYINKTKIEQQITQLCVSTILEFNSDSKFVRSILQVMNIYFFVSPYNSNANLFHKSDRVAKHLVYIYKFFKLNSQYNLMTKMHSPRIFKIICL